MAGYINAIYTHMWAGVHTKNICNEKLTTLRGKKYSRNSGSGIDGVEYERHIGPRDDVPGISFPVPPILTDAYKMHRYRVHDLLTFANRYLVQFTKFPAEASSLVSWKELRNYSLFFFFSKISSDHSNLVTIIIIIIIIIIRIITWPRVKNAFAMFPR